MIHIIANGFGVLSTLCFIASFQVKSNKGLYIIQSVANVFYGTQFYLLGATGGLFNMGMQIVRNLIWGKEIRVANMLPMVILGVALSYLPGL